MEKKKYFKGKTFFAVFESGSQKKSCFEYIEKGFDSRKAFFDWVRRKYGAANEEFKEPTIISNCKIIDT